MSNVLFRRNLNLRFTVDGSAGALRYLAEDESSGRFVRLGQREYILATIAGTALPLPTLAKIAAEKFPTLDWSEKYLDECVKWLLHHRVLEMSEPMASPDVEKPSQPATTENKSPNSGAKKPFDILSFRIPIIPGAVLERVLKWPAKWLNVPFLCVAAVLVLVALGFAASSAKQLSELSKNLFVPESKYWWVFAWLILKTVHEMGHALVAVRISGSVRQAGLSFFCLTPIPYVDVSDVWRSAKRTDRILCSLGGVLAELLLAAIAVIICCNTDSPALQYATISIVTLGTLSTIAFNANPLMRYDGYYVLSDLLERPSLWTDATAALNSRVKSLFSQGATSIQGHLGLACYGLGTLVYRGLMLFGMAWGAITIWEGLGWLVVGLAAYSWFISPTLRKRSAARLAPPKPTQLSKRKVAIAFGSIVILAVATTAIRSPLQRVAPGMIVYANSMEVRPQASGILVEHLVAFGESVQKGQPIARLENSKLVSEVEVKRISLQIAKERVHHLTAQQKLAEAQAEKSKSESIERELAILERQVDGLTVIAPQSGRYLSNHCDRSVGDFVNEQHVMGIIADPTRVQVETSIAQQDIDRFRNHDQDAEISTMVQFAGRTVKGKVTRIEPKASVGLPDPTFAAIYGGPIAVRQVKYAEQGEQLQADEARFTLYIDLPEEWTPLASPGQRCVCWPADSDESLLQHGSSWLRRMVKSLTPSPS